MRLRILDLFVLIFTFAVGFSFARWFLNDAYVDHRSIGYLTRLMPFAYSVNIGLLACVMLGRRIERSCWLEFGRLPILTVAISNLLDSLFDLPNYFEFPVSVAVLMTHLDSQNMMPAYIVLTSWICLLIFGRPLRFEAWIDWAGMVLSVFWVAVLPARFLAFHLWDCHYL
ncbi:MAG: hypothetical protein Aurels2KO_21590 [Aureliella sp.]